MSIAYYKYKSTRVVKNNAIEQIMLLLPCIVCHHICKTHVTANNSTNINVMSLFWFHIWK